MFLFIGYIVLLMTIPEKIIKPTEFDNIINKLNNFEKLNIHLAKSAMNGSSHSLFRLTDEERRLQIKYIQLSGSVVNMSEAEPVECHAIVKYDDMAWFIQSDAIQDFDYFPTLKQAFYEHKSFREREADYKYHFSDGETFISIPSSNPVDRLDENIEIKAIEYLGGEFPKVWILQSTNNEYLYLRERSGTIRLYHGLDFDSELIFHAFIGREHPGTHLKKHEIINIITSMDYFDIIDNPENKVSEEAHEEYWKDALDDLDNNDYKEL